MDPISAIGLVENSLGLAIQFGSAAKALNDIAGKYKNAKLTIKSLAQNLDILQLAWTQIGEWYQEQFEKSLDDSLTKRVEGFLETGNLVMEALQHDLQAYSVDHLSFSKRSKLIWNETTLQGHKSRIQDQALSMSLFLQAVNLPTPQARAKLLQESETQFQNSDESAYSINSIVPSHMSVSTSQRDSYASGQSQDIVEHHRLSFEKRLFMSKVYIRSSKDVMVRELSKARTRSKRKGSATVDDRTVTDWEAIRDQLEADSLLATNYDVSINDNELIKSRTSYSQSRPRLFVEDKITSLTGMTLDEELIWACQQGNNLKVKRLADRGADLHAQCKEAQSSGFKGIHVAAMHGHIAVVETLLDYGAMVEEEEASFGWRPLHIAAKSGQDAMVKFLIQKGAQIDARACHGVQPIHEASGSGSVEALDALVEAGAAIDCSDTIGYQPLHFVTQIPNRADAITYLLRKGANIEAKTHEGSRPLQLACTSDSTNFCTLIALGAKMEYDDGSESVLQAAIRLNSKWAVELLIHGAELNRQNDSGKTILHDLARVGATTSTCIEICQLLLDNGADVNIADNAGDQMLHCLAALSPEKRANTVVTEQLTELVLHRGADIDTTNKKGLSPLYLAMRGNNRPLSKLLLRSGARKLKRTVAVRADVRVTTLLDFQTPSYTVYIWLKRTVPVGADVHAMTLLDSQAPKYMVNIGRDLNDPEWQWRLSTKSSELSIDDEGCFDMVCEALADDRAATYGNQGGEDEDDCFHLSTLQPSRRYRFGLS